MTGTVYLLVNEAMPGLVKIGKTTQDDPSVRMDQLYSTGVPVPFECALAVRVDDPSAVERALHTAFGPNRINPRREFFKIMPEQAVAVLKLLGSEDVTPSVNAENASISPEERQSSTELRKRRPRLNFAEMGIPAGAVMHCVSKDAMVTVLDDRNVSLDGETMSITRATQQTLDLPYQVAPGAHWTYEGRLLNDIYNETYPYDG